MVTLPSPKCTNMIGGNVTLIHTYHKMWITFFGTSGLPIDLSVSAEFQIKLLLLCHSFPLISLWNQS